MVTSPPTHGSNLKDPTLLTFRGKNPGKTLSIFAGVHGNEIGGVLALRDLIKDIKDDKIIIKNGTLHLVFANPTAISLGVRQTDMNMNRSFHVNNSDVPIELQRAYERQRAISLQILLDESDALLDLHSTLTETSPLVICEKHSFEIAKLLPFPLVSTGWDQVHPGSTDAYMNLQGKVGICVECGQHNDPEAKARARTSIEIFLRELDLVNTNIKSEPVLQRHVRARFIYKATTCMTFIPAHREQFCNVKKGELLGMDGDKEVRAGQESILFFPKEGAKNGEEAFVLGEVLPF